MNIWALADVHLSFGVKGKEMDVFGDNWKNHPEKIRSNWLKKIQEEDLVLMAGDISWALHLEDAKADLDWIDQLPGTKVMIRGNHDLWWKSISKVRSILPPSIQIIHHNALVFGDIAIGGTRLWDHPDIVFDPYINFRETPGVNVHGKTHSEEEIAHDRKVFASEVSRLHASLNAMAKDVKTRILMLHHPPTGPNHEDTEVTNIIAEANIDFVVYGHLHSLKGNASVNFTKGKTKYIFTAADYLDFDPIQII